VGALRIIAGELRGRRLKVPPAHVRPTAERVREALFAILGPRLRRARVLDLYSGSGALGIEALSRGAAGVTFVESDRQALATIRANLVDLGLASCSRVVPGRVLDVLARGGAGSGFDLVLADPPYDGDEAGGLLASAGEGGLLAANGVLSLEISARAKLPPIPPPGLEAVREARYGAARLVFYRSEVGDPEAESPPEVAFSRRS